MNKKAFQSTVYVLIILLIVAFILYFWIGGLAETLGKNDRTLCRLSVLQKAQYKLGPYESPSPLDCPSNSLQIDKRGIFLTERNEKNGKIESEKVVDFKGDTHEESEDKIKKYLAEELAGCWSQYGAGQIDFMSDIDFEHSEVRCFPCASVFFKDDSGFLDGFNYEQWEDYLAHEMFNKTHSYKQYLRSGPEQYNNIHGLQKFVPDSNQLSITLFTMKRAEKDDSKFYLFFSNVVGYRSKFVSLAHVTYPQFVSEACDQFY